MSTTLSIGPISVGSRRGVWRAEANVDGRPLWFETGDAELSPAAEAFGGAMLIPALDRGYRLHLDDPVCPQWYRRMADLLQLTHRWWNYPEYLPRAEVGASGIEPAASGVGLCFTGGVDSFYSLLHSGLPVDTLIYAIDYDVPPGARHRRSCFEAPFRKLCQELGVRPVVVRSNLREHPAFEGTSWEQSHGGALVALGHLLHKVIGTLVVSSSYSHRHSIPYGSHWELDPHWSSSRLQIVHFGECRTRMEKVRYIVSDPHVQHYLRPCWENPPGKLNCSVCEKCVRTQVSIARWGELAQFGAFDRSRSLVHRIDRVRRIPNPGLMSVYQEFLDSGLPDEFKAALNRLMRRSRWSFARKHVRRRIAQVFRISGRPGMGDAAKAARVLSTE